MSIELVVEARPRDLGDGFTVRRALPTRLRRMVGPFIFWDHMGPMDLAPGHGMDVRPHPHIGLATLTFLWSGEIVHKDSLGSDLTIRPGDVNWMVAGRGIVHSERSSAEVRAKGAHVHGIQAWIALPRAHEEMEPRFEHHPKASLPRLSFAGVELVLIAGEAYGARSPVGTLSPTFYVDAYIADGARLALPDEHAARAAYVVEGRVACDGQEQGAGTMIVFTPGPEALRGVGPAHVMLLGGAPLDGERHIEWNFVSSDPARITRAKDDWRAQRFPKVAGDAVEFVPLPTNSSK